MLKKEVFNLEDSNVAGLGSDMDKKCRADAAATEKAWAKAGKKPGLQVWRIEQFKVKASQTALGTFYDDDSYICLKTYQMPDENGKLTDKLGWDIHFWLGKTTTQDEYGTAAYKTVELDDFLGGGPVQHRECSGHESTLFLSYFEDLGGIKLLTGGAESGFNHVEPEKFTPRLLHLKGRKNVRSVEVPIEYACMNSGDVFILDMGLDIYQWQGKKCGKHEKAKGGQLSRALDDERRGKPEVHVYSQGDKDEWEFFQHFKEYVKDEPITISEDLVGDDDWETQKPKKLYQLSDSTGDLVFSLKCEGKVKRSDFTSDDCYIMDIGCEIFVFVGSKASAQEKEKAMHYATEYIKKNNLPTFTPVTKYLEGGNCMLLYSSLDG